MMATVPHVTSDLGLRKFQTDGFLLTRAYKHNFESLKCFRHKTERPVVVSSIWQSKQQKLLELRI